jgi:hypothetical protein
MIVDDLFSVVHAAVTDLDGISVEDFSKFVVFWEVLVYHHVCIIHGAAHTSSISTVRVSWFIYILLGFLYPTGCNRPLVKKLMLSASSFFNDINKPKYSKFKAPNCWSPGANDVSPYLQIDIHEIVFVTAIATQGGALSGVDYWVKSYQLWFSFGGKAWRLHMEDYMAKVCFFEKT